LENTNGCPRQLLPMSRFMRLSSGRSCQARGNSTPASASRPALKSSRPNHDHQKLPPAAKYLFSTTRLKACVGLGTGAKEKVGVLAIA